MWLAALLIARDAGCFVLGAGMIIQQMLTGHPDPQIMATGAALTGIPAWLHNRSISRTASDADSSPSQSSPPESS